MSTTFTCTTLLCPWPTHCSANHPTVLPQPPPAPPSSTALPQYYCNNYICTRSCLRNIQIQPLFWHYIFIYSKTLALLSKTWRGTLMCVQSQNQSFRCKLSRKIREMNNVNRFGDKGYQRSSVTTPTCSNAAQPQPLDRFKRMFDQKLQVSVLLSLRKPIKIDLL